MSKNNEEKILEMLGQMQETISNMQGDIQSLNRRFDKVDMEQSKLRGSVVGLSIKEELREIELFKLREGQEAMQSDLSEVKISLADTKERVILIENEHGQKLGMLLDGHKFVLDKLEKIQPAVERHEEDISLVKAVARGKLA